jgi:hypothetical protein
MGPGKCWMAVRGAKRSMSKIIYIGDLAREYRLLVLFCVLVGLIIFTPIAELQGYGHTALTIALVLVIAAAVNAAREHVSLRIIVIVVGLTAACLQLGSLIFDKMVLEISNNISSLVLLLLTTSLILKRVLAVETSNFDTLCGAAAIYLMLGITWTSFFSLISLVYPDAFLGLRDDALERWNDLMYFSFTTLTTLGYGDVAPTNTVARIWATLEAVAGTLYLTILVARLVAIYSREHAARTDARDG